MNLHLKMKRFIILTILLACVSMPAGAGTITLTIETTTNVTGTEVMVIFRLLNSGSDSAWQASVQATVLDQTKTAPVAAQLMPGAPASAAATFSLPQGQQGSFPILAQVRYQDMGGKHFAVPVVGILRTQDMPEPVVRLRLLNEPDARGTPLRAALQNSGDAPLNMTMLCHTSEDLSVIPQDETLQLPRNQETVAEFRIANRCGSPGSRYDAFLIAVYEHEGQHQFTSMRLTLPVDNLQAASALRRRFWPPVLGGLSLLCAIAGIFLLWLSLKLPRQKGVSCYPQSWLPPLADLTILILLEVFLFSTFTPHFLLTSTITAGGDTASHYYTLDYLRHTLLPQGQVSGWTPGNYAGFPILQLYFPLPFLMMCLLDVVLPLQAAFKFGSLLGVLLLPAAAYLMLRLVRCPFPGPAIGAALMLPFLYNNSNSMWGGNILSTLAGEFAYSLSLALSLIFLGSLYRGCRENRYVIRNALLVFLVGFSHGYTLLFVEVLSLFFLITPRGVIKRAIYLFKVYALGGLLLAFWLIPLLIFGKYTSPYHLAWVIYSWKEFLPDVLLPVVVLAVGSTLGFCVWHHILLRRQGNSRSNAPSRGSFWGDEALYSPPGRGKGWVKNVRHVCAQAFEPTPFPSQEGNLASPSQEGNLASPSQERNLDSRSGNTGEKPPLALIGFLWWGIFIAVLMFVAATQLGVVDIRYVPCGQLMTCLLAALGLGWLGSGLMRWKQVLYLGILMALTLVWTHKYIGHVPDWTAWNYSGFEAKPAWPLFSQINNSLRGTFQDPRVVFEHAETHNMFGSSRAFESLPLFSGRATLEGLYHQASLSSPFVFYLQSEVSKDQSCPFTQYYCTRTDFASARAHLDLFNARDLILVSPEAKAAIRRVPGYELRQTFENYELWQRTSGEFRYVIPLRNEPVLYLTEDWKTDAYRWFLQEDLLETPLVFANTATPEDYQHFRTTARSWQEIRSIPLDAPNCEATEMIRNDEILINTTCLNRPLLVKMSYHPNWKVEGAKKVYLASPAFMLIFPEQEQVRLYYGASWPNIAGRLMTGLGLVILLLNIPLPRKQGQTGWLLLTRRFGLPANIEIAFPWNPSMVLRRRLLAGLLTIVIITLVGVSAYVYTHDPNRWFNQAVSLKDSRRFEDARALFRRIIENTGEFSRLALDAMHYIGITYYLEQNNEAAIQAFQEMIRAYPRSNRLPEAAYHIGLCYFRMNREDDGIKQMQAVVEQYPHSVWANYAQDRLREHRTATEGEGQ